MSDDPTKGLPRDPSFEEKVFARFDAIDVRLLALEQRAFDTKPIWERALAEILEVKQGVAETNQRIDTTNQRIDETNQRIDEVKQGLAKVERKIEVLSTDIVQVRADQRYVERRVDKLESEPVR